LSRNDDDPVHPIAQFAVTIKGGWETALGMAAFTALQPAGGWVIEYHIDDVRRHEPALRAAIFKADCKTNCASCPLQRNCQLFASLWIDRLPEAL
jgi:hypothetical protein